ncbi:MULTISPECIES: SAF domain-containing protein [unclassified Paenibacillus]|uniref:Flp pilus assembly protein CpaB n=1 Tax=unclassified Paenibacillus TaxID=185978 RepID=UPI00020D762F|nr:MULTISPECIES: SAF domain-containing protein [unclassified Paenibacillus]EGL15058.1 putative Flp pilus assembly protein CpaB [Paenibacillus sp. HGF7]EPD80459.1 flp pilus assembly protein CpaB [Paenibacillus sp. HGH0039]
MLKSKTFIGWLLAIAIVGFVLGLFILNTTQKISNLVPTYVAIKDIPVDTVIEEKDFEKVLWPKSYIPEDAIKDPKEAAGKFTYTTILKGQVIKNAAVSDAKTMREVVRKFGLDYVGMAIPIENTDLPIEHVKAGDTVDIIGTFNETKKEGGQEIITKYVAENVPVTAVVPTGNKVMIAVGKAQAKDVARNLAAGKIKVLLNPNSYGDTQHLYQSNQGGGSILDPVPPATEKANGNDK